MPAGPKPPMPITAGSGDPNAGKEQFKLEYWVSKTDPDAVDIRYSDFNMAEADLNRILQQYLWSNGKWAYEIDFDAVSMPWLRKGVIIHLTDLYDNDGEEIVLQPADHRDLRPTYDEGSVLSVHDLACQ